MTSWQTSPARVGAFSDAVFAVITTVLVLELKPPSVATFRALLPLWPTGLSYVVGYLFIAIVWVIFVLVNITYLALCFEAVDRPAHEDISARLRRLLRMRSFITVGVFVAAAVVALKWPLVAMVLICTCLIVYLRPDIPAQKNVRR